MRWITAALVSAAIASAALIAPFHLAQADAQQPIKFPEKVAAEGFQELLADVGPAYVAGQPSEAALEKLKAEGVTKVISLRTPQEMDNRRMVPFDEAAKAKSLGMTYVNIPLGLGGPESPYTPEQVDAFAAALGTADGKVLLHCTVGWRASHMWAAYLVRHRGYTLEDAIANARAMNFGYPMPVLDLVGAKITVPSQRRD
ncbi:hypothetical protein GC169_07120 [bacterium]|nr:hypothetical protein [bacterium]